MDYGARDTHGWCSYEDLKPEVFSSPAKHAELVASTSAYEHFLRQNQRGDMATVYEEALKHPDWCPVQSQDYWTELPDTVWSPLQRLLIDSMPGERIYPCAFELSGIRIPRRLMSRRTERLMADVATNELAFLMSPASVPARTSPKAKIALFHAGGREAEIEEVFRRILATGASLDQVEIACASDAHVALIWEKALRHNWPVTLGPGIPAAFTRPGRALIGLCDWIETDFSAGHFRRLLQSGDLGRRKKKPTVSLRDRQLVCWGARKPVGDVQPMASRLDGFTRATNLVPRIRMRRTKIALMRRQKQN